MKSEANIIFENMHWIVVFKPSGWLTVPGRFPDKDTRKVLGKYLEEVLKIKIYPTHRLDFEVSGLVLYAKNADSHRLANLWFENQKIKKTYAALTEGLPPKNWTVGIKREWKSHILKGKKRAFESEHGKLAITEVVYRGDLDNQNRLLWHLYPITGRSHQLRLEMYKHGYPIIGDSLYGSKFEYLPNSIALQCFELNFTNISKSQLNGLPDKIAVEVSL